MIKTFKHLRFMLVMLLATLGVNVAFGAEVTSTKGSEVPPVFDSNISASVNGATYDSKGYWVSGGSAQYIYITAKEGYYIQSVQITAQTNQSSAKAAAYGFATSGNGLNDFTCATQSVPSGSWGEYTLTPTNANPKPKYFIIARKIVSNGETYGDNQTIRVSKFVVTYAADGGQGGTDPVCSATAPGDITKGAKGNPLTLTAAGSPATNNTWYWQTAADGEDKTTHSGVTFDVTTAGTYYVRSYCSDNGGCWSAAKSIVVTDADLAAVSCPEKGERFKVVFNAVKDYSLNTTKTAEEEITSSYATVTNGKVYAGTNKNSDQTVIIKNQNSSMQFLWGSANTYLKLELNCPLANGDVISFESTTNYELSFTLNTTRTTTYATSSKTYTVTEGDGLKGQEVIYLWRYSGSSTYVHSITIRRPAQYNVKFAANGGVGSMEPALVWDGATYTLPTCSFEPPTDKEFDAWTSTDVTIVDGKFTMPTKDVTVTATWKDIPVAYSVKYGDDHNLPAGPNVENGTKDIVVAACTFTAPGDMKFRHWAVEGLEGITTAVPGDKFTMPANNVTFTAVYDYQYTVRFFDGADQIGEDVLVWDGDKVSRPADPIKIGYHAIGWKNAEVDYDFEAAVTGNLDLTVNWDGPIYALDVDFEAAAVDELAADKNAKPAGFLSAKGYWYGGGATTWDNNTSSNNGSYLGLKMKEANSTVEFLAEAGKMLVLKVGILDASKSEMYQNGVKVAENMQGGSKTTGDNFKLYYFHSDADAQYMFKTTANNAQVIKAISFVDPYKVTFAKGGEIDPMYFKGTALTLPAATGEGEFQGWFYAETGGDPIGKAGDSYTPTGDVELFAQFSPQSTNNEIASFTYGEETVVATEGKREYAIELPYKSEIPASITVTKAEEHATVSEIAKDGGKFTFKVTAQSGAEADYAVTFTVAPKDGICLIHADITGQAAASVDPAKSTIGGTATANGNVKNATSFGGKTGYKFNSEGARMSITLAEGSFKTGDVVKMFITTAQAMPIRAYSDNDATVEVATGAENMVQGLNSAVMTADAATLYLARTGANGWNPNVAYVEVYRAMNPILSALTVAGVDAVIDQEAKTISVKLVNGTDAATAELVPTIIANGGEPTAALDGTLAYGTPINYVVTDKDGDQTTYVLTAIEGATPAAEPVITVQPASHDYADTEVIAALTVEATVSDAGVLSYQWYKGEEKVGENLPMYTPTEAGSYKVVVTNTLGEETATATSEVAVITVTHYYTFASWTEGVSFTKAGEWTMTTSDGNGAAVETTKFATGAQIDDATTPATATAFTGQYFIVKFAKDMKKVELNAWRSSTTLNSGKVYVHNGTKFVEISYTANNSYLDSEGKKHIHKYVYDIHFEAGKTYFFKLGNAENIYDFFATAASVVSPAVHEITAVEIGGEVLDAAARADFVANKGMTLPKTDAAFAVKVTETVSDIYDDEFVKLVDTPEYNATATLDGDNNFVATLVINNETYTVSAPKMGDPVAKIGTAAYETLAEAVAAAENGDEIVMLADVDLTATGLIVDKEVVLDLNGHNIKAGESNTTNIYVTGKLTVEDNSADHNGKIYTEAAYSSANNKGVVRVDGGEFILNSGNIEAVLADAANNGQFGVVASNGAKITINGGQIKAGWYAISANGTDASTITVVVNGGELISTADYAIYQPAKNMTTTITDGVVYGATGAIAANAGVVTVNGGTITSKGQGSTGTWGDGTGGLTNAAININAKYGNTTCAITGGKIIAEGDAVTMNTGAAYTATIAVSGGAFSSVVPAEYCAEGYEPVTTPNAQGLYEVEVQETILDIEGDMTFNFVGAVDAQVNGANDGTYKVLASYGGVKAQANGLYVAADFNKLTTKFMQANGLKFHTTVPGFITVTFAQTGNDKVRELYVNGVATGAIPGANQASMTYTQFVEAGDVVLTAWEASSSQWRMFNYAKIEFTAAAEVRSNLEAGRMYTYCPAQNVAKGFFGNAEFYVPENFDGFYVNLMGVDELKAGYGYIMIPAASTVYAVFNGDAVSVAEPVSAETRGMQGYLGDGQSETLTGHDYVFVKNNHLQYANANYVTNGKAYLCMNIVKELEAEPENPAPRRRIGFAGNTATLLDEANGANAAEKMLINGQVMILRGGKFFDATGRLMK